MHLSLGSATPMSCLVHQTHGTSRLLRPQLHPLSIWLFSSGRCSHAPSTEKSCTENVTAAEKMCMGSCACVCLCVLACCCDMPSEADLMFSFGYEADMRALCSLLPSKYQAMLFSATLSEEVEQLKVHKFKRSLRDGLCLQGNVGCKHQQVDFTSCTTV